MYLSLQVFMYALTYVCCRIVFIYLKRYCVSLCTSLSEGPVPPAGGLAGWLCGWLVWLALSLAAGARRLSSCKIYGLGEPVPAARWERWKSAGAGNWPSGCRGGAKIQKLPAEKQASLLLSLWVGGQLRGSTLYSLRLLLRLLESPRSRFLSALLAVAVRLFVQQPALLGFASLRRRLVLYMFLIPNPLHIPSARQVFLLNYRCFRRKRRCR